uniref:RING-type domain-containing protein n=1 Tax=Anopheles minimus TaxID=112268 RepID=A0A182WG60_9DIPT
MDEELSLKLRFSTENKMVLIHIGNLKRTDRPLTWLPEPTCDGCTLPFTYHADELYNRLPLLLSCKHLLCGLCVREHSLSDSIKCERCKKHVPLPGSYENVTEAFQPSYYMLGMMAQMQQELKNVEQYYESEHKKAKKIKNPTLANELPEDFPIESLSSSDISSTRKMKAVLERAYDSYEKAKHALDRRSESYPKTVDQVVQKINGHFLAIHNALQIEQDRALLLVRKTYLEQLQHIENQQQHLIACKKRLLEMHERLCKFYNNSNHSDDESWLQFRGEVKHFLERVRMKLSVPSGSCDPKLVVCYSDSDNFVKSISSSYRLVFSDLSKSAQLVPFTASKKHRRLASDVAESSKKGESDAGEWKLLDRSKHHESSARVQEPVPMQKEKMSDRSKHHESVARKTVSVQEQSHPVPNHSERERKLSDRSKHYESVARK